MSFSMILQEQQELPYPNVFTAMHQNAYFSSHTVPPIHPWRLQNKHLLEKKEKSTPKNRKCDKQLIQFSDLRGSRANWGKYFRHSNQIEVTFWNLYREGLLWPLAFTRVWCTGCPVVCTPYRDVCAEYTQTPAKRATQRRFSSYFGPVSVPHALFLLYTLLISYFSF